MRSPYGNASLPRTSRQFSFPQKQYVCVDCGYQGIGAPNQVVLTMGAHKPTRSTQANRYYWLCIVGTLAEHLGYTKDEMHDCLKMLFLKVEPEPEKGRLFPTVRSTASLKVDEFERYMDDVRMWAARDLGIICPLPGEELAA